jgi:hypothetical protein
LNLTEQIKQIDTRTVAESAGCELRRKGNAWVGLCPLHDEKTPSFYVYPSNRFKCYGCGEGGDAVDLTQDIYGCSFPEALRRLGISTGTISIKEKIEIKRRRIAKARRIQRERDLVFTLALLIRTAHKCSEFIHLLPAWTFYHDILSRGTKEEKNEVIEGLKDWPTIRRRYLFRPNFNYRRWLFNINNRTKGVNKSKGAATNERIKRK